ncbi:hypothetical protein AX14_009692 [Amanita brunnescens Koide BX004]|nr:hypothetical protein AX14_009692 [Amanita brunnescens Koide BX004]
MGAADSMDGSGENVVMSAGGTLAGEGVGDRATPSGSGSAGGGQFNGTGCRDWVSEAGDNDMAGGLGAAGDRRTSGTARDGVKVSAGRWGEMGAAGGGGGRGAEGNGGNEACRGDCV